LPTANGYKQFSSKYIHEYIISINIMVITNIGMTTQYIQEKTTLTYTRDLINWKTHSRMILFNCMSKLIEFDCMSSRLTFFDYTKWVSRLISFDYILILTLFGAKPIKPPINCINTPYGIIFLTVPGIIIPNWKIPY
jgi:hypothetical protein